MTASKPRIAVVFGDPGGIGPELVARHLSEPHLHNDARVFLLSDEQEIRESMIDAGVTFKWSSSLEDQIPTLIDNAKARPAGKFVRKEATREGGLWTMSNLRLALDMARSGTIDAIVFAPLNKTSLHLAGMSENDEMEWFESLSTDGSSATELNILPGLTTSRVTSHIQLSEVAENVTIERIVDRGTLLAKVLRGQGHAAPRIGVAALNPHAGEQGRFGRHETEVIAPAVAELMRLGVDASGPFPADTIFVRASRGEFDGVVTMYHDQGQIAVKLLGFEQGVTLAGGFSVPICTPAHGTAFALVGSKTASTGAFQHAFSIATRLGVLARISRLESEHRQQPEL